MLCVLLTVYVSSVSFSSTMIGFYTEGWRSPGVMLLQFTLANHGHFQLFVSPLDFFLGVFFRFGWEKLGRIYHDVITSRDLFNT
mmetsp:Transcript_31672/g.49586  ORF Transcript_31672/g.49586 Transcript_31672/m.49586 type:complete len:84 (-) Transcript_31672:2430-2681(-)